MLTLRQFDGLAKRYQAKQRREDRRAGEVVAILHNIHRDAKTDAITWLDVFPEHQEPKPEQTDEQMLEAMMMWANRKAVPQPD
jgi:alpha-ketoglutarate-dependent taurine dioxygenase